MGNKHFCDICDTEITKPDEDAPWPGGYFYSRKNHYDLCFNCTNAVERFLIELKEKHRAVLDYKKDPNVKGQKEIGDFE